MEKGEWEQRQDGHVPQLVNFRRVYTRADWFHVTSLQFLTWLLLNVAHSTYPNLGVKNSLYRVKRLGAHSAKGCERCSSSVVEKLV